MIINKHEFRHSVIEETEKHLPKESFNKKIHFITYGCENYNNSLFRICEEANESSWFDEITAYTPNDIPEDVYVVDRFSRGGGYWSWKPYIVKESLKKIKENDILVYLDAGCTINKKGEKRFFEYIDIVNKNNFLGFACCLERQFTKKDVLMYIAPNNKDFYNSDQIISGIFLIKKCDITVKMIDEWFEVTRIKHMINDDPSVENNEENFIEHRHDQSCLSLLVKKYNLKNIPDETYFDFAFPEKQELSLKHAKFFPFWATRIRE